MEDCVYIEEDGQGEMIGAEEQRDIQIDGKSAKSQKWATECREQQSAETMSGPRALIARDETNSETAQKVKQETK